ncbi:MAG: alcohol dehydrogenase catalytic domain-containing protein, partial [Lutibacter sp.]
MILNKLTSFKENSEPLRLLEIPVPKPKKGEVLIKVGACGVCHTEIDEIEGRTPPAKFPVILGHQVVGRIVENGEG